MQTLKQAGEGEESKKPASVTTFNPMNDTDIQDENALRDYLEAYYIQAIIQRCEASK